MSGLSSSEENLLMSNGFSINDMKHSVDNHGMFEGKDGTAVYINRDLATLKFYFSSYHVLRSNYIFSIIDDEFHTSPLHSNPSVTRIPAMALPLQEGPETCSRNVSCSIVYSKARFNA